MTNQPLIEDFVTVITPTYNAEKYVIDTIQSVKNQTHSKWEMIIVDDCSKDQTVELIQAECQKDPRIKLIQLEKNSGAAVARNTAISNAKGRYIAFLDSDDLWYPEKLEKQLYFMQTNKVAFSFSQYSLINEDGSEVGKKIMVPERINYKGLLKNTIIGCLTVMLDIKELGRIKMSTIETREDTAMWLAILKKGYVAYGIQEPLAKYRRVHGSVSSNKMKMAKQNWEMYRKLEKLNLIYSSWVFANYAWNAFKKSKY